MQIEKGVGRKFGILIVEDDDTTRALMSRIIASAGFRVKEAALAADGFKAVDNSIDLVIVDIALPDYDGQNLVTRLRRRYDKKRLKICFASGLNGKEAVEKSLQVGGDDYIVKPIDKDHLLQKVTKLLGQSTPEYAWVATDCSAEMSESSVLPDIKIVRLSESGLLLKSSSRFLVTAHIKIQCPALTEAIHLPFHEVNHRVTSCNRIGKSYFIATEFVGLTETFLQPIRGLAIRGKIITDPLTTNEPMTLNQGAL